MNVIFPHLEVDGSKIAKKKKIYLSEGIQFDFLAGFIDRCMVVDFVHAKVAHRSFIGTTMGYIMTRIKHLSSHNKLTI